MATRDDKQPTGVVRPTARTRSTAPRDLTASVPDSLTVSVELPAEVRTLPEDEAAVALDEVAITPSYDQVVPATRSIDIVIEDVQQMPEPAAIPPLPDRREARRPHLRRRGRARGDGPRPRRRDRVDAHRRADDRSEAQARRRRPRASGSTPSTARRCAWSTSATRPRCAERKAIDAKHRQAPRGRRRDSCAVLTRKGGVGKTTISTLLGMALADVRDDRVIAIDANPDRGTLAERVNKQTLSTVRDIVSVGPGIRDFTELSTHVSRDATRLDVLASDTDPNCCPRRSTSTTTTSSRMSRRATTRSSSPTAAPVSCTR